MTTIDPTYRAPAHFAVASSDPAHAASADIPLPEPDDALALSGDPVVALAQLSVKEGNEQRGVAEKAHQADEQTAHTEDELQVQAMRQKADEIRTAGYFEGAGMMVEAGLSATAAGKVLDNGTPNADGNRLKAASTFVQAAVEIHSSASKAGEASLDADSAEHKAAADQASSAAADMHDAKKDAEDYISAALDFYREYTSSKASEASATLHRS
jgi:hypothetical protein